MTRGRDVAEHVELGAARALGLVLELDGDAAGLQRGAHRAAHVDVRVAAVAARLVALGGEPALELRDDAVDRGEVLRGAGRQRAVELVERARRAAAPACARSARARARAAGSASKRRIWSRVSGNSCARALALDEAARLGAQPERAADPLDVDAEHAGALAAAAEGGDRQPREVAQRGLVAVADGLEDLLAQRVVVDPLAAGDAVLAVGAASRTPASSAAPSAARKK